MSVEVRVRRALGRFEIDAQFRAGAGITALFGRSGSGKTSIIDMVAGLLRPHSGRIVVAGRVLYDSEHGVDIPVHRRGIGYVFQQPRLFPHYSVRGNLLYGHRFARPAPSADDIATVVDLLGIGHLLERRPGALSGGEKQRVAIGRALLTRPQVLLMDEPMASLDSARRGEILPYLERLRDEARLPVLYVSHSIEEVSRLADTLVLVSDGRVVEAGPLAELMGRTDLHPLTGRHEAGSLIDVEVARHDEEWDLSELTFSGGSLRVPRVEQPVGTTVRLRLRARDISVALQAPKHTSIRNAIAARVLDVLHGPGAFAEVRMQAGEALLVARITRHAAHELGLDAGKPVWALVKSVAVDRRSMGEVEVRRERTAVR